MYILSGGIYNDFGFWKEDNLSAFVDPIWIKSAASHATQKIILKKPVLSFWKQWTRMITFQNKYVHSFHVRNQIKYIYWCLYIWIPNQIKCYRLCTYSILTNKNQQMMHLSPIRKTSWRHLNAHMLDRSILNNWMIKSSNDCIWRFKYVCLLQK